MNHIDPEVARALENSEDDGELDDNFIELAGGLVERSSVLAFQVFHDNHVLPSPDGFQAFRERKDSMDSDNDTLSDQSGYRLDDDAYTDDEPDQNLGSGPNRSIGQEFVDEHFETIIEAYGEEKLGEGGLEEDVDGFLEPDSNRFNQLVAEHYSHKRKLFLDDLDKPDDEIKRRTLEMAECVDEAPEKIVKVRIDRLGSKRNRWDCESVLSTYSNQYNHPTLISEPPRKKKGSLAKIEPKCVEKMDMEVASMTSRTTISTYRPKNETSEEHRSRKTAIKEERRERRQAKKLNRIAFKEEKKQLDLQTGRAHVNGMKLK